MRTIRKIREDIEELEKRKAELKGNIFQADIYNKICSEITQLEILFTLRVIEREGRNQQ